MDTQGNVWMLEPGQKLKDNEILIGRKPNPNCKDCFGRGHITYILENIRERRVCGCTKRI